MWTSTSRGRERALNAIEEIILDLMGSIDEGGNMYVAQWSATELTAAGSGGVR